jgi:acyl-CoA synthetase (AMP-forming)/AMP-acid ligase II
MTVRLMLEMTASAYGDRVALGSRQEGMTFAGLEEFAAKGATVLSGLGAKQLVLLARNGPLVPQALFSASYCGASFVPLNYRLSAAQIQALVSELDAPIVIAERENLQAVAGTGNVLSAAEFAEAVDGAPATRQHSVDENDVAVLLFTSGTTAKPKAVVLRHAHLSAYVFGTVDFGSAAADDTGLVTVPPYHIAAVGAVLSNVFAARRVVYLPDFTPEGWLALIRREHVTSAMVVPTMMSRIVDHLGREAAGTPSLRHISYGGARMPAPVIERALEAFPDAQFVNAYGLTETSSTIALLTPEDHRLAQASDDERVRARLGSAGRPVPGIELQIRAEDGRVLRPGEAGELWIRGAQVSGEYRGLGSVLDAEGWFPTRDLASVDEDGYLFVEGRADDTIIRGGENIAPAEIEDALLSHPGIAQAAVVGPADEEWGQRIAAVVVLRPGWTLGEELVRDHVRTHLRGSRTPDLILFRQELPHTPTGKLLRGEVLQDVNRVLRTLAGQQGPAVHEAETEAKRR